MKTIILSVLSMLFSVTASAQATTIAKPSPQLTPVSKVTADKHGIIRDQPEGEYRIYVRDGGATYATIFFIKESQAGIVEEVVFSEDGKTCWLKNIVSHATTYTWVEGSVEGNTITVPLGQMVHWFDDGNYGMRLARVKVDGDINKYTVDTKGSVTFTIDGDKLILNGTSGDPDASVFDGLGLVYTDSYDGEWSYYLDYETVLTYLDEKPVTPPADLETEAFSMENEDYGHLMEVGFYGNDVYMRKVTESKLADSWIRGYKEDGKVVFPAQMAGIGGAFAFYFCGIDGVKEENEYGGYSWKYEWPGSDLVFDYDEETRTFTTPQTLMLTTSLNANDGRGEIFHSPKLRPYEEHAGTPSDPSVIAFVEYAGGALNVAMFVVPLVDTEGRFMDPEKLSYRLFVDDDEPYILYPDEYEALTEPMEEIPYLYSDRKGTIIEKAYGLYVYQTGFDRFGIQSIYRGGGEEHQSNIGYWYFNEPDGIQQIENGNEGASRPEQFDLQGRRVGVNHKGLVITRMNDGRVVKSVQR